MTTPTLAERLRAKATQPGIGTEAQSLYLEAATALDEREALLREIYGHGENFDIHDRMRAVLGIVDDEGRTIAHVHRRTGMEPCEYKRNAHLLAEAPDLKAFEQTAIKMRGEIEYVHVENDRLRVALEQSTAALHEAVSTMLFADNAEGMGRWKKTRDRCAVAYVHAEEALAAPRAVKT